VVEKHGWPVLGRLFAGNHSDFYLALPTVDSLPKRPGTLAGDKGFDAKWLREAPRQRHIQPAIPRRKTSSGKQRRSLSHSAKAASKNRWKVERGFAWLDGFRRLVTRWERYPSVFEAFLSVAIICILLR
jgi:transposase